MLNYPATEYDCDNVSTASIWFVSLEEAERRLDEVLALEDAATDARAQAAVDQVLLEGRPDLYASPVPAVDRVESPWSDGTEAPPPGLSRRELADHYADEGFFGCLSASNRLVAAVLR